MEGTESGVPSEPSEPSQRGSVSSAGIRALEVLVYLVNDTAVQLTVENLPSVSAQDLGRTVREALQLPETAQDAFAFWLSSPLLELQLKPKHQPYKVCRQWPDLLYRFTEAPEEEIAQDEPCLQYRRNVFFPKAKELQLQDEAVLRLLYEEARCHVLAGRYPCDPPEWQRLGGLACRLELGPPQDAPDAASPLREKKLSSFLPAHVCRGGGLLGALRGRGARHELEQGLLEAYRRASGEDGARGPGDTALLREYLHVCHTLPYYGCAFFSGEIDKPVQGILQRSGRKTVSVAVSLEGVYVMDPKEKFVLLGLHFHELSWDHTYPEEEGDSHILWLEFDGEEAGTPVNRLLKIYSKQAELMSGLIEYCVELGVAGGGAPEGGDGAPPSQQPPAPAPAQAQAGDGRRGKLHRQSSVVSSRMQRLHTISYVDDGKEIKRLKPRRAASFFTRQAPASQPSYSAVQAAESLEQG